MIDNEKVREIMRKNGFNEAAKSYEWEKKEERPGNRLRSWELWLDNDKWFHGVDRFGRAKP